MGIGEEKIEILAAAVELVTHLGYADVSKIKTS